MEAKRRDDKGRVLLLGESQDKDGRYRYRYTDALGKRQTIYSWRLTEADDVPEVSIPAPIESPVRSLGATLPTA